MAEFVQQSSPVGGILFAICTVFNHDLFVNCQWSLVGIQYTFIQKVKLFFTVEYRTIIIIIINNVYVAQMGAFTRFHRFCGYFIGSQLIKI